jgi:hypothetical protein
VSLLRWGGRQAVSSPGDRGRLPSPRFCRLGPVVLRGPRRSKVGKAFPPVPACCLAPGWRRSLVFCHGRVSSDAPSSELAGNLIHAPKGGCRAPSRGSEELEQRPVNPGIAWPYGFVSRGSVADSATRESRHPMSALIVPSPVTGAPACVLPAGRPISPTNKRNAAPELVLVQGTGAAWPNGSNVRCTR